MTMTDDGSLHTDADGDDNDDEGQLIILNHTGYCHHHDRRGHYLSVLVDIAAIFVGVL